MDSPLRRRRLKLGLLQKDLARECGVRINSVWRYESGRHKPAGDILIKLMDLTGLSARALIMPEAYLSEHPDFDIEFARPVRRGRPRSR